MEREKVQKIMRSRASRAPTNFKYARTDIRRVDDKSSFKEVFSYNLVKLLSQYNITSAEMGRKIDAAPALVRLWRSGCVPNEKNMKDLCSVFEVEYADFFKK